MPRPIEASLSLRSSVIAMKQALKLNRLPFEWTTKIFLWFDIFSDGVEWKATSDQQPSFTALLSRAIFMYSWIWLSLFIQHTSWAVCFCDRTCVFLWTTIQSEFTEHFTFTLCIRDKKKTHTHTHTHKKKLQEKVLNWTCQTNSVCKLLQIVNFDVYWTLMVWHFWQHSSCSTNHIIEPFLGSWYAYWRVLYESTEHGDDTDNRFGSKVCFENWK